VQPIRIKRWRVLIPVTGARATLGLDHGMRSDTFDGVDGQLTVTLPQVDWPYTIDVRATGNGPGGRGARGHIPVHVEIDARDLTIAPGAPKTWTIRLVNTSGNRVIE